MDNGIRQNTSSCFFLDQAISLLQLACITTYHTFLPFAGRQSHLFQLNDGDRSGLGYVDTTQCMETEIYFCMNRRTLTFDFAMHSGNGVSFPSTAALMTFEPRNAFSSASLRSL